MLRKEVDIVNWEILAFVKELKLTRSGVCWNGASDFTDSIYREFQVGSLSKTTTGQQNKNQTHLLTVPFANRLGVDYRPKAKKSQRETILTLCRSKGCQMLMSPCMRCDLEPMGISVFDVSDHGVVVDTSPYVISVGSKRGLIR